MSAVLPTFAQDLVNLRAEGKRPLGGVVVTDSWRAVQGAKLADLFPLYLRARDDWTAYDLAALFGLDVMVHLDEPDFSRVDALIEHVKSFAPRSIRVGEPERRRSERLLGEEHALAELARWLAIRASLPAKPQDGQTLAKESIGEAA